MHFCCPAAVGSTPLTAGGTENVYDELGRIKEVRRWANIDVNLVPLCNPDDANVIVGLKVPAGIEPNNAQAVGGDLNIGWTSGGVLLWKIIFALQASRA